MTNRDRAKEWLAENLVKDSGQRLETLARLLDEAEERGRAEQHRAQQEYEDAISWP